MLNKGRKRTSEQAIENSMPFPIVELCEFVADEARWHKITAELKPSVEAVRLIYGCGASGTMQMTSWRPMDIVEVASSELRHPIRDPAWPLSFDELYPLLDDTLTVSTGVGDYSAPRYRLGRSWISFMALPGVVLAIYSIGEPLGRIEAKLSGEKRWHEIVRSPLRG